MASKKITAEQRRRKIQRQEAERAQEERHRRLLPAQQASEVAVIALHHRWYWYPRLRNYLRSREFPDPDAAVRDALQNGYGSVQDEQGKTLGRRA